MKKYKILMALMGLEIGGAETHVVELSKELKKQGYDIIVASNGGVYEKELAEAGIRHYHVPHPRIKYPMRGGHKGKAVFHSFLQKSADKAWNSRMRMTARFSLWNFPIITA